MEKQAFQKRMNSYAEVIRNYLIHDGLKFDNGTKRYTIKVNEVLCNLTIDKGVVELTDLENNVCEYFIFTSLDPSVLYEHYSFSSSDSETVDITYSLIKDDNNQMKITSAGAKLGMIDYPGNCANKIIFFCHEILGNNLFETVDKIADFASVEVLSVIQDVPKQICGYSVIDAINNHESLVYDDLQEIKIR